MAYPHQQVLGLEVEPVEAELVDHYSGAAPLISHILSKVASRDQALNLVLQLPEFLGCVLPVSVIPTVLIRIPFALGSSHAVGALEGYRPFIVHENVFPRLVKLGVDMIERDALVLFLFLSPVSVGTVIFPLGIILSFWSRA